MAPDAEDCEQMERLNGEYQPASRQGLPVPTHQGRRVLPEDIPPAQAWTENEEPDRIDSRTNSPGENRRLLPLKEPPKLQAGLTLGVWGAPKRHLKTPLAIKCKPIAKTKKERRREKLIAALKPPYFILSMIIVIVCIHIWGSKDLLAQLEWSPSEWWREPWRLLTYGLVHASDAHLALNALVALAVGWRLEHEQSAWRVVLVWCGGVVGGALGAGALQPRMRVVGASAAVYALLTAHLPNVCFRFGHIPLWWFRPLSVVVLAASEASWALLRSPRPSLAAPGHTANHVAWAAHMFGAAVGVPLAFLVFTGENKSKPHMVAARILSAAVLAAGVVLAAIHYAFWHQHDFQPSVKELIFYHKA